MNMNELFVICEVDSVLYAIAASTVVVLDSYTAAVKVPGTAEHVVGLVLVRGMHLPVIDLRVRFGLPQVPVTMEHRIVVVSHGARRVALLADRAREVLKLDPASIHPPPEVVAEQSSGFVAALARHGERTVLLLDVPRVIGGVSTSPSPSPSNTTHALAQGSAALATSSSPE